MKIPAFSSLRLIAGLSILLAAVATAPAQSNITAAERQEANTEYTNQNWKRSADLYKKIAAAEPANNTAVYRYGLSLLNAGDAATALPELKKVYEAAPNNFFAFALARAYANLKQKEQMYEMLDQTVSYGGMQPTSFESAKDFDPYRKEAKFVAAVDGADKAANPCKASPQYREFDFWIGEWDVKNPQGVVVGSSSIQLILNGCIIYENYQTPVYAGKSFNIWDREDKKWHQTWVDVGGVLTEFVGGIEDGKMVYVADEMRGGNKVLVKMTFTKLGNGDVRQLGEQSTDDGKTWTTRYDLTYSRKNSP